ncbi:hypothetical protein [Bacillus paranthracis]|uniref:hypothetical protein n=1 Tax=Bacillus paranthracis TaxID=2026186 RepID=UPI00187AAE61|nr:hypothetical protein [Bacillus paranthracis]
MIMFVLHEDETDFFNFTIPNERFKVGDKVEREDLDGTYVVVHCDPVTVSVKPV